MSFMDTKPTSRTGNSRDAVDSVGTSEAWWQLDVMNLNAGVMFNGSGQASPVGDPNNRPNVPLRYSAPGFIYQGPPELTYTAPSSRAPPPSPGYAISPHKPASTIEFSTSPTRNHPRRTSDPENSPRPVVQQPPESLSRVSMFDRTSVEDLPCIVPVQLPVQPPPPQQPAPARQKAPKELVAWFKVNGLDQPAIPVMLVDGKADWNLISSKLGLSYNKEPIFDGVKYTLDQSTGFTHQVVSRGSTRNNPVLVGAPPIPAREEVPETGPYIPNTTPIAIPPPANFSGPRPITRGPSQLELSGSGSDSSDDKSMTIEDMNVSLCSKFQMACMVLTLILLTLSWIYVWAWWFYVHQLTGGFWTLSDCLLAMMLIDVTWDMLFGINLLRRAKQISPLITAPRMRVAMITTRAPSEAFDVLKVTLTAMLKQDYPYTYDVWLADEKPTPEVIKWCRRHSVHISCRFGVEEYHQAKWPRRTKCKEGNLAYFYDQWGYATYDVVAQFDADHVPDKTYLSACLPAFRDPNVAYVAAPSVCSQGGDQFWSTRGRLYHDATFHGVGQATFYPYWMPSCIGSHYTVRTSHLQSIGGIGPELDEDFSTSYMLSAKGYEGVFSLATKAIGEGPPNFEAAMKQEYQWARSLVILTTEYVHKFWNPKMRLSIKYRAIQCCWYYIGQAFFTLHLFALITFPVFGFKFGEYSLLSLAIHVLVPFALYMAHAYWLRAQGWLRPIEAPILSWEKILHGTCARIWTTTGVFHAFVGQITGIQFKIKVTPKGSGDVPMLGYMSIVPICCAASYAYLLVIFGKELLHVPYSFGWTWQICAYAVVYLHYRENHREKIPWENLLQLMVPLTVMTGIFITATLLKWRQIGSLIRGAMTLYTGDLPWDDRLAIEIACLVAMIYFVGLLMIGYIHRADAAAPAYATHTREKQVIDKLHRETNPFVVQSLPDMPVRQKHTVPDIMTTI